VEVALLGPLVVVTDSGLVGVGAQKERALCAALALRAGRVVPLGELIDALWGVDPPPTAAKTLQGYISRLRRTLGPAHIITERPGYRLALDADAVDVARFTRLVDEARGAARRGETRDAIGRYADALLLWRGQPLLELTASEMGRRESARLIELRHAAVEEMLEARLTVGEHNLAIADLEALVVDAPLRERAWELLMLALYRSGRQADALRTYQRARELLVRQIGVEPGAGLKALESAVIAQDPQLQASVVADSSAPPLSELLSTAPAPVSVPIPAVGVGDDGAGSDDVVADGQLSNLGWVVQPIYPFAGRDAELAQLDEIWDATAASSVRHTVLIGGEPGIGKTRLVGAAAATASSKHGVVLFGSCEDGLGAPYQPFVEAVAGFARSCPPPLLAEVLGPLGAELTRLVPELRQLLPGLDAPAGAEASTERHRLFEAVSELLERLAAHQPVLLVLDDLHWATTPTLLLLRHLVSVTRPARLMIAATYRPTELDRMHPLSAVLADLRRHARTRRISLDGLDEDATITLAAQAADHALAADDEALIRRLNRECGGNPFFFWTMLTHLVETGMIVRRGGRWTHSDNLYETALPEGVREVVSQRLSSLDEATNALLRIAALIGSGFDYRVVAAVAGADPDAVLDSLEPALQSRVIVEHDRGYGWFLFAHDLLRRSLEEELSTTRRARLQWRIATVLTEWYGDRVDDHLDEVARHATEGALAGDLDVARDIVQRAGDAALDALAFEASASYYDEALAFCEPTDLEHRYALLLARGRALHRAGNPDYEAVVGEAIEVARLRHDPIQFAEAVLELHHYPYLNISAAAAVDLRALLEEGLADAGETNLGVQARMTAALAKSLSLSDRRDRAIEMSTEALRLARLSDDPRVLAEVLTDHSWAITGPDTLHDRVAHGAEAIALADGLGDDVGRVHGYSCLTEAYLELGDVERAASALGEGLKLAEYLRRPRSVWGFNAHKGSLLLLQADVAAVEAHGEHLQTLGTELGIDPSTVMAVHSRLVLAVHYERGELHDFEEPLAAMIEQQPDLAWGIVQGVICVETGRLDEVTSVLDRYRGRRLNRDIAWVVFAMLATIAIAEVGDAALAADLYEQLLPFAGRNSHDGAGTFGPVDLGLGRLAAVLERPETAVAHYQAAATLCARWHAPMWAAHTAFEHGKLLLDLDTQSAEAAALLRTCTTIARRTGQTRVHDRAAALHRA